LVNRGVTFWSDTNAAETATCRQRIFLATIDARLFALDASTGHPCDDFGIAGQINLKEGISNIKRDGEYEETSAPAVIDDLVIVGSSIADNDRVDSPDGAVRAFCARTGKFRWSWQRIQANLTPTGAGNVWSTISVDAQRDLVFLPTGSASPDYHGFKRPGDNKWANSVVALSASTGQLVWGFQLVHHDLWDYDTAAQPILGVLRRDDGETPAVIQRNKTGNLFVLDRETGRPVFGVEERQVPKSDTEGEDASPTQPFPLSPPALAPQKLTANDAWGINPDEREACRSQMEKLRSDGIFTAPSVQGTIAFAGNLGGMKRRVRPEQADLRHKHQQSSDGNSPDPSGPIQADRKRGPERHVTSRSFSATRYPLRHQPSGPPFATWIALQPSTVGRTGGGRPFERIHSVASAAGHDSRLGHESRQHRCRHPEPGRSDRYGCRPHVHCIRNGQLLARLRYGNRGGTVEGTPSLGRSGDADDLPRRRWQTVYCDCRRRPRQVGNKAWGFGDRLFAAIVTRHRILGRPREGLISTIHAAAEMRSSLIRSRWRPAPDRLR
jgi:hypothetical protein